MTETEILDLVRPVILSNPRRLEMAIYHSRGYGIGDFATEADADCGTTHCLAGWCQVVTGEHQVNPLDCGNTHLPLTRDICGFFAPNAIALAWLRGRCYAAQNPQDALTAQLIADGYAIVPNGCRAVMNGDRTDVWDGGNVIVMKGGCADVWNGGRAVVLNGGRAVVLNGGRAVVKNGGHAVVMNGGRADVRNGGFADVFDGGRAVVKKGGYADVMKGGHADVLDGGSATVSDGGHAVVKNGGRAVVWDDGIAGVKNGGTLENHNA